MKRERRERAERVSSNLESPPRKKSPSKHNSPIQKRNNGGPTMQDGTNQMCTRLYACYCRPTFIRDIHKRVRISTAARESPLRRTRARAVWVGGGTAAALLVVIVNPSCLMENIKRRRRRKRRRKKKNPFVPRWRMRPLAQTPTDSYTNLVLTVTETKT